MQYFLSYTALLPAAILCYLPVIHHVRVRRTLLIFGGIPLFLLWAFIGGILGQMFHVGFYLWLAPMIPLFAVFFYFSTSLSIWKSISILLAVGAVFSTIGNLAVMADALIAPDGSPTLFTIPGCLIFNALSWGITLAVWYPATHAARWLLDDLATPHTWYVFWIFPTAFWITNRLIRPRYYSTLYTNRVMQFYPLLNLVLLGILLCFYLMFYLMAKGLIKNMKLVQENEFFQLQSAQYRTLQRTIDETRMARHDLRHHFTVLSGYAANSDMKAIQEYLTSWQNSLMPKAVYSYCKNPAVNNVLGYYARLARESGISIDISAKLQEPLIIPEPEFCVLLGNLLENAVEACKKQTVSSKIHVRVLQTTPSLISLTIDNTCSEPPRWHEGKLLSSKHDGNGIGTRSAKNIAARYHGDARFEWKNGMFCVSILLNPHGEEMFS